MRIEATKKDLLWSYLGYFFNIGTNVILLPLILHFLNQSEIGIWYTFISVYAIVSLIDFGFSTTLNRNLTYAWSGVTELKAEGFVNISNNGEPNIHLFATVFLTTKILCFILSLIVLLVMSIPGSIYVHYISNDLNNNLIIFAWLIYVFGCCINIYFNYWSVTLISVGAFAGAQKAVVISKVIQLTISIIGLVLGGGLVVLSVAYLLSGIVMRLIVKKILNKYKNIGEILNCEIHFVTKKEIINTFKIIWVNAKNAGIWTLATTIMTQSGTLLCSAFIGVAETAIYGLCFQLNIVFSGIGRIFYQTNLASLINAKIRGELQKQQDIFSISIVLLWVTITIGNFFFVFFGKIIFDLIGANISLKTNILILMGVYILLDTNFSIHAHYISLSNTLPFVKSLIITTIIQLCVFFFLIISNYLYLWSILLVNLISVVCYRAWKWPTVCLKELNLTASQLFFLGIKNILNAMKKLNFN